MIIVDTCGWCCCPQRMACRWSSRMSKQWASRRVANNCAPCIPIIGVNSLQATSRSTLQSWACTVNSSHHTRPHRMVSLNIGTKLWWGRHGVCSRLKISPTRSRGRRWPRRCTSSTGQHPRVLVARCHTSYGPPAHCLFSTCAPLGV
jgi:hypothetical protein